MTKVDTIGIIGYGEFGSLLPKILSDWPRPISLRISSIDRPPDNQTFFDLKTVSQSQVIIISVPIDQFASVIEQIRVDIPADSLVMDVCSIQTHPQQVMLEQLPETVDILTTHPNFGPESYRLNNNTTNDFNWIVDRTRCRQSYYDDFTAWLNNLRVDQVEMTATQHDKTISVPHFVSLCQGIIINRLQLSKDKRFVAVSTRKMIEVAESVGNNLKICQDIVRYNPFVGEFLEKMIDEQGILAKQLSPKKKPPTPQ